MQDVIRAMSLLRDVPVCLMQCNTNYTGKDDNFECLNLNVIPQYAKGFPNAVIGLSDHSIGHVSVLGAVALGARIIEKHFTDTPKAEGPDHGFSTTPQEWYQMVVETRQLERALGDGAKKVEGNEQETVVLQRRCLRAARDLPAGHVLEYDDIVALRPAPFDSLPPHKIKDLLDKPLIGGMKAGEHFRRILPLEVVG